MNNNHHSIIALFESKDYIGAINAIDKELLIDDSLNLMLLKGKCLLHLGSHTEAEIIFRQVLEVESKNFLASYELGNLLLSRQEYAGALDIYKNVDIEETTDSDILNNIGLCYLYLGNFSEALEWYMKALAQKPDDSDVLNNIGMAFYYMKDYKNALKYFNEALKVSPNDYDLKHKIEVISSI